MSTRAAPGLAAAQRLVLFTTGIRSEYDILSTVIRAVDRHPRMKAGIVVTGAHLSELYGTTVREIEQDGFTILGRIESLLNSNTAAGRVKSAAIQLISLVDFFVQHKPDIVVAMADREESLTVAVAGSYLGIPVAHIGGGDNSEAGYIDNAVRHAVSKLAHVHLVTTPRSAERLIRMGEDPWRIHVVGAPGLDRWVNTEYLSREELSRQLDFDVVSRPFSLVIQHPNSTESAEAARQIRQTLQVIAELSLPALVSYPNSDAGSQSMIEVIREYDSRFPLIKAYQNLTRTVFVNLMRHAAVLIGNSSCGIIESPLLKLPVVNVGDRQEGREHAENVLFVPQDPARIKAAILQALEDGDFKKKVGESINPYGDGHSGERIATILADLELDRRLVGKRNAY